MSYFRQNINDADGYVPGFQPQNADVVKLNTNENPYPPSPKVVAALGKVSAEQLRRYPDPLGQSFKQAAGNLHGVDPDWILCCNGGDDLLSITIRAICDSQRPLAYPVPTYSLYPVLAQLHGCPVQEIPFNEGFTLPSQLVEVQAPLTIVCNPNAPSGTRIETETLATLAEGLKGVLLIDEAYVDYANAHCLDLVRDYPNVLVLRSMSKGYSLAGVRFGYGIAQPALLAGLLKVKDSYNVNAISMALARAAIEDQDYFQDHINAIKRDRQTLTDGLRQLGMAVVDSQTNFVLAQVQNGSAQKLQELLGARDIHVRYFALPGLQDKLRITVGTAQQNVKLLDALKALLP